MARCEGQAGRACQAPPRRSPSRPAVANRFALRRSDGELMCAIGNYVPTTNAVLVAPGAIALWIAR